MKAIGVVGAGIMAAGIAQNFLKHGYEVHVWNRTAGKLQPLLDRGAHQCESPALVAAAADIVIECVADDDASRSVWLGDSGILSSATADKVLIASSTLSLTWVEELAGLCRDHGLRFLDMPLTGSRGAAESGTLTLLVGGEASTLDEVRADLQAVANAVYHFGANGTGMRFKLLLNALIAIHVNAAAQAVELARKSGIAPAIFRQVLTEGNLGPASPVTKLLLNNLDQDVNLLNFAVKWLEKDLRYAKDMAALYDTKFDLLDDTHADFLRAKEAGWSERDMTAIAEMYRSRNP